MRRNLAILLLACATLVTAVACSSSNDTATTGTTSTTGKGGGGGDDKTATTKAPLNPDGPKCGSINNFLIATQAAMKPEAPKPENKDKILKQLKDSSGELKKQFAAKEQPDIKLRTDTDAMLTYLNKLVGSENPTPAEKDASEKAKDDLNKFKGLNCKKDDKPDASTTEKPAAPTTTAKK